MTTNLYIYKYILDIMLEKLSIYPKDGQNS